MRWHLHLILLLIWPVRYCASAAEYQDEFIVDYCRNSPQRIALSDDRMVFCFDGFIERRLNIGTLDGLRDNGYFVVRSPGGYFESAGPIADVLRKKKAKVVIYDYCLSACANYFFVASGETLVSGKTIVAWHGEPPMPNCPYPRRSLDTNIRPERPPTKKDAAPNEYLNEICGLNDVRNEFFSKRGIDSRFIFEPQSPYTKKMAGVIGQGMGYLDRSVFWMWNPRYYAAYFRTPEITYNSYPKDELEVDQILEKSRISSIRVVYDP